MRIYCNRLKTSILLPAGILLLTSCTMGHNYNPPVPDIDSDWHSLKEAAEKSFSTDIQDKSPPGQWWSQFNDDTLLWLLHQTVDNNNDLKIAEERILEARAGEGVVASGLFPQVNGTASVGRQKLTASSGKQIDKTASTGVNASLDLDLFGSTKRRLESAKAGTDAQMAQRDQTRLILISEVAQNYVRFRSLQQQYNITTRNLEIQKDTLNITEQQRKGGAISDLEVVRAKAQVGATNARLPQIKASKIAVINHICVLTGYNFDIINGLLRAEKPIPVMEKEQIASMPIDTIKNRPDINLAERQLASTSALNAAAFTDLFPKLTLEGSFGAQYSKLYGGSAPWGLTAGGLVPLLNFGKLSSAVDAADSRQRQALLAYKQSILLAVEETENAFTSFINEQSRRDMLEKVASQQASAAKIARKQYESGVTSQLDLLVAEKDQLDAENELALSEQAVAENIILLHRALGDIQLPPKKD